MQKVTNADRVRAIVAEIKATNSVNASTAEATIVELKNQAIQRAIDEVKMKPNMAKTYVRDLWVEVPKEKKAKTSFTINTPKAPVTKAAIIPKVTAAPVPTTTVNDDDDVDVETPTNRIIDLGSVDDIYDAYYSNDIAESGLFHSTRAFSGYGSDYDNY